MRSAGVTDSGFCVTLSLRLLLDLATGDSLVSSVASATGNLRCCVWVLTGFADALLIGIFVGTYSSVYVASSILLTLGIEKEDLLEPVKEDVGEELP